MRPSAGLDLGLYVVTDLGLSRGRSHEEVARLAVEGGANVVQLRDKGATTRELYQTGLRIRDILAGTGATFIVNDRVDVALAVDADGVHLGQDDMPTAEARRLMGPEKIVGVSLDHPGQAAQAVLDGATYVAIGPVYEARGTKPDAGSPVGPGAVRDLRSQTDAPIVAIGGIKANHIGELTEAGADGMAVVSAVVSADDIVAAAREIRRLIAEARV